MSYKLKGTIKVIEAKAKKYISSVNACDVHKGCFYV